MEKITSGLIMSKVKNGRPTVMTDDVVRKLLEAFAVGANDTEACSFAEISRSTYALHKSTNEEFSDKIDRMKDKLPLKAKSELAKLLNSGDSSTVKWYLERVRRHEYSTRTESENKVLGHNMNFGSEDAGLL
jgi:hypothetical protein